MNNILYDNAEQGYFIERPGLPPFGPFDTAEAAAHYEAAYAINCPLGTHLSTIILQNSKYYCSECGEKIVFYNVVSSDIKENCSCGNVRANTPWRAVQTGE